MAKNKITKADLAFGKSVLDMAEGAGVSKDLIDSLRKSFDDGQMVDFLAAERVSKGMSLGDVAQFLECSPERVAEIENGFDGSVLVSELKDYAKCVGVKLNISLYKASADGQATRG